MIGNDENVDLDKVDRQFQGLYERGLQKGIEEARGRDMAQFYQEGVEYGKQWGLQFGYQAGFLAYLDELKGWKPSKKVSQTIEQIKKMMAETTLDHLSVEEIDRNRAAVTKKFKILMRLLHVTNVQNTIREEGLDF